MPANPHLTSSQPRIAGFEVLPQATRPMLGQGNKLIVMLKPPPDIANRQEAAMIAHCELYPGFYHPHPAGLQHLSVVTLWEFPENPPEQFILKTCAVLEGIVARPIAFKWVRTEFFGRGKKHLVLLEGDVNNAFRQFARLVQRTLRAANLPCVEERHPVPHVALIYDRRQLPRMEISEPTSWIAEEFLLVLSIYGKGEHRKYGAWSFDRSAPPYPPPSRQLHMDLAA